MQHCKINLCPIGFGTKWCHTGLKELIISLKNRKVGNEELNYG
jgi:hypothetical protein